MLRALALLVFVAGCASPSFDVADDASSGAPQTERDGLRFTELAPGVWLHTSYKDIPPYGPFTSNGLVVARGTDEAVLIDTPGTTSRPRRSWLGSGTRSAARRRLR